MPARQFRQHLARGSTSLDDADVRCAVTGVVAPHAHQLVMCESPGRPETSGCRLAVKRCALGALRRPAGDGGAGHPLCGCQVQPGAGRGGDYDSDVVLQAAVASGS